MVVTKMKGAKIKYRKCDWWSLTSGIKKRKPKKKHTFTERIEDKTNSYINERNTRYWTLKLNKKSKSLGNIKSIMGCYLNNGEIGDNEPALNTIY